MFDRDSRPTIVKSVVESADSGIEPADSTADSVINPLRIDLWIWGFKETETHEKFEEKIIVPKIAVSDYYIIEIK